MKEAKKRYFLLIIFLPFFDLIACTSPTGVGGEKRYVSSLGLYQFCDGTNWVNLIEPGHHPQSFFFNGSTYLAESSAQANLVDSKRFTISFWIKLDAAPAASGFLVLMDNPFLLRLLSNSRIRFFAENSAGTDLFDFTINTGFAVNTWYHVLVSADLNATTVVAYLNDSVASLNYVTSPVNGTIDFTNNVFALGAQPGGAQPVSNVNIADFWFAPGVYIDITSTAERRKFINSVGNPVFLGANGQIPTGSSPNYFFAGESSVFGVNNLGNSNDMFLYGSGITGDNVTLQPATGGSACTTDGELTYDTVENKFKWCKSNLYYFINISSGAGGCVTPTGVEGELNYSTSTNKYLMCDGAGWIDVSAGTF